MGFEMSTKRSTFVANKSDLVELSPCRTSWCASHIGFLSESLELSSITFKIRRPPSVERVRATLSNCCLPPLRLLSAAIHVGVYWCNCPFSCIHTHTPGSSPGPRCQSFRRKYPCTEKSYDTKLRPSPLSLNHPPYRAACLDMSALWRKRALGGACRWALSWVIKNK